MGTLSDEGAESLLNCPAISELDFLFFHDNYLSEEIIQQFSQIGTFLDSVPDEQSSQQLPRDGKLHILPGRHKEEKEYSYLHGRYCSVAE